MSDDNNNHQLDDADNRLDAVDEEPRRTLPGILILPSAATLGNLICGFLAIFCCLLEVRSTYSTYVIERKVAHPWLVEFFPTYVAVGVYLIVVAMIFDALDGRLARLARRTTEFGAQLDSLSDIVSFGVAPALLFITLLICLAQPPEAALVSKFQWRLGMLGALVYVSCAAIRLARYNAENTADESATQKFSGLPTPGAAAAFIALLVLHEDLRHSQETDWANVTRWVIGSMGLLLGVLMVSRVKYVHVFNVYIRRHHPPTHLVWLLLLIGLGWTWPQVLLVLLAYTYVLSGPLISWRHRGKDAMTPSTPEPKHRAAVER